MQGELIVFGNIIFSSPPKWDGHDLTQAPLKVFLCHAHIIPLWDADRDVVRALYTRLTKDGVDAWLNKENFSLGRIGNPQGNRASILRSVLSKPRRIFFGFSRICNSPNVSSVAIHNLQLITAISIRYKEYLSAVWRTWEFCEKIH